MIPLTPTPIPPGIVPYTPPSFSLWGFTDGALQIWNTLSGIAVFMQALILVGIVAYGLVMFLHFLKQFSNQAPEE
jgi:hypothetical protein